MSEDARPNKLHLPVIGGSGTPNTAWADFQNDVLARSKTLSHESAAHEKRNWVRLSYDCNNHCIFCLDSNAHDGTMRDGRDIKVQIVEGRKRGADRLILSGGEPTMHPNFLDFVLLGKRAGYPKVQTVTNGRMFQYPDFLNRAADNGLDEITFSLHGHTAKLHDALVGTPGAFEEEVAGLKAALASGRFIVNVDVVINKRNVRHLPEMLETFVAWGVREFDLLHVIPFGNAWTEAKEHLFYDLEENLPHLQKAFSFARRPDIHVWLNRFPPPYTEGFEDLIQDPYKLNDEVRGRREEFDRYLSLGEKLSCREPERCNVCYLQSLCDGLDDTLEAVRAKSVDRLRVEGRVPTGGTLPAPRTILVVAPDLEEARALASQLPPAGLELDLQDYAGLAEELGRSGRAFGRKLVRCHAKTPETLELLTTLAGDFEIAVALDKQLLPLIAEKSAVAERIVAVQPNYDFASTAKERDVEGIREALVALPAGVTTENVPKCLSGERARSSARTADAAVLGPDGRVLMAAFTQRFIEDGFYSKPVRCGGCIETKRCAGVHVNWVRAHGFGELEPIRSSG
jgi:MoaA/NifB/PqqE/SkfB family radical SAM enzyme